MMKEYTIKELVEGLDKGKWTSVDLVGMYIDQISKFDQSGPKLNAISEINPEV